MSGELKLMMITDPKVLLDKFGYFIEGLESILKYTHGDSTLSGIFEKVLGGQYHLWVAFYDNTYAGLMTTRFEDIPQGKKFLTIMHVYTKPNIPQDMWIQGYKEVENLAKKYGCNALRMWTEREKGFTRKLKKDGWKPMYVEFVKEVSE